MECLAFHDANKLLSGRAAEDSFCRQPRLFLDCLLWAWREDARAAAWSGRERLKQALASTVSSWQLVVSTFSVSLMVTSEEGMTGGRSPVRPTFSQDDPRTIPNSSQGTLFHYPFIYGGCSSLG